MEWMTEIYWITCTNRLPPDDQIKLCLLPEGRGVHEAYYDGPDKGWWATDSHSGAYNETYKLPVQPIAWAELSGHNTMEVR